MTQVRQGGGGRSARWIRIAPAKLRRQRSASRSSEIVSFSSSRLPEALNKSVMCHKMLVRQFLYFVLSLFSALKADEKQMFVKLGGGGGCRSEATAVNQTRYLLLGSWSYANTLCTCFLLGSVVLVYRDIFLLETSPRSTCTLSLSLSYEQNRDFNQDETDKTFTRHIQ